MRPTVFVTRKIPEQGIELLRKHCDVEVSPHDRVLSKQEIIDGMRGKDALLCLLTDKIDAELLDSNPRLRVVSNYAVGVDNVDVKAATERHIPVCNTPGVLNESVADHAIALMLAISRRIVEADRFTRAGNYHGWAPMLLLGNDVFGKTIGVVGLGRIGRGVAERAARGFNMKVLYYDIRRDAKFEKDVGAKFSTLGEILKKADYISIHVPLLPQTRHLFGAKEFKKMKNSAYLINTSRGPVVDEQALVAALRDREIAGAALDVFENEPALSPGLAELDNVIVVPHIASATVETRGGMSLMAAENLLAVLEGKKPKSQVNPDVKPGHGYKFPFYTQAGKAVKTAAELGAAISAMGEQEYASHVNEHKNDFANWVGEILKNKSLAGKLRKAQSKEKAGELLKKAKA